MSTAHALYFHAPPSGVPVAVHMEAIKAEREEALKRMEKHRMVSLHAKWLEIYAQATVHQRKAMREMYRYVDELLMQGHIASCDSFVKMADLDKLPSMLWGGLLTITFMARELLPSRAPLYQSIFKRLAETESEAKANSLLRGLK